MRNFTYRNPVNLVFGKGKIAEIAQLVPSDKKVLVTYGGGSIKKNGVYDQVREALANHRYVEFGGIEPNPSYETLMEAVQLTREEQVDFLLAVGGGSVIDGTKFIAAAAPFEFGDPWDILEKRVPPLRTIPFGTVLTLPATGSEMNCGAVISRQSTAEKLVFSSPLNYPQFSVLDPKTTYSLPPRQLINGIVDAYVHVMEQYCTYDVESPLQDRFAEAILITLIKESSKILAKPVSYEARATFMYCATCALNGWIACGVATDWSTHMIGHELTALYGIDHGESLAIVLPGVLEHEQKRKSDKLCQYATRVWGSKELGKKKKIDLAIDKTEKFFNSLGMKTRLSQYKIPTTAAAEVAQRIHKHWGRLGEHQAIGAKEVEEILQSRM